MDTFKSLLCAQARLQQEKLVSQPVLLVVFQTQCLQLKQEPAGQVSRNYVQKQNC